MTAVVEEAAKARDLTGKRVLIVDDVEINLLVLAGTFRSAGFTQVLTCEDAATALELIDTTEPDLVLLDLHMPTVDGFAVLERLRERPGEDFLPVIVVTADLTNPSRDRALALGAHDYLTKPTDSTEVLLRSVNLLRARVLHQRLAELLEKTLAGSVETLLEVLALANPAAFGRVPRLQQIVRELPDMPDLGHPWVLEMAAGLSQLGAVTLGPELAARVVEGRPLAPEEQRAVDDVPRTSLRLLQRIPQLDEVRDAIRLHHLDAESGLSVPRSARALRVVFALERLEARGLDRTAALDVLRSRPTAFDQAIVAALATGNEAQDRGSPR